MCNIFEPHLHTANDNISKPHTQSILCTLTGHTRVPIKILMVELLQKYSTVCKVQGENFMEYKYVETQEIPRHKINEHCRILACLMFSVTY
jgi:hypothetical protein